MLVDKPETRTALQNMERDLGRETVNKVITSYQTTLDNMVESIVQAFDSRSQDRMRFLAQQLKSASVAVGATTMQKLCDRVTAAANEKSPSWDLAELATSLRNERIELYRFFTAYNKGP